MADAPGAVRTASGKTARANIARLRAAREQRPTYEVLIAKYEALATQASITINAMRFHFNELRQVTVESKQVLAQLKKTGKVDIQL